MMKTITVKLQRPATVDVIEFELPHFSKKGATYYAVINPLEAIEVSPWPRIDAPMINIQRSPNQIEEAFSWESEASSREEFMAVYTAAFESITTKILSI